MRDTIAYIKDNEGIKKDKGQHVSYVDTEGHPTGGFGHKLVGKEKQDYPAGTPIPTEIVDAWFKADMERAYRYADRHASQRDGLYTNPTVKTVITDMSFQLGDSGVDKFINFHGALANGDLNTAAAEILNSKYAKQDPRRATKNANKLKALAN